MKNKTLPTRKLINNTLGMFKDEEFVLLRVGELRDFARGIIKDITQDRKYAYWIKNIDKK